VTSTASFDGGTNQLIDSASQEYLDARWFDGFGRADMGLKEGLVGG